MNTQIKLAVPVVACLLVFGLWLAFVWLPPESGARRGQLLFWLVAQILVTLALLWWGLGRAMNRQLARLANALACAIPGMERVPDGDPFQALTQRFEALVRHATHNEAALRNEAQARRAAEVALQESQERYTLAVRGADDGLWEWQIASGAMYLSPRWKGMLGFGESELAEQIESWRSRVHPEDRSSVERTLQAHLAGEISRFESEHRVLHKDGGTRWVLSRGSALRHANGRAYRMIGLDADITQYKRIEATLQHVAAGTANVIGVEFYRALVMHFAQALNVSEVFVTECLDQPPTRVRTLACWERGQFITDEYELAPTPCKIVFDRKERYFLPRDLALHFPNELPYGFVSYLGIPILDSRARVLGHIVFKDDNPMEESVLMDAVFRIFTARVSAEMRRTAHEKILLRVAQGFTDLCDAKQRLGALVSEFAHYVGAREAFITHCLDDPPTRVRVLCYWNDGALAYDIEYDLAGNPCEQVYGDGKPLYWPKLLGDRWPLEREFNRESYLGLPVIDRAS
jgi:PAS domain S-box-containing protein